MSEITGYKIISQGIFEGGMAWSDTGKYMYQLQLMLLVDCTITNIQNFSLEKIVDFVPLLK